MFLQVGTFLSLHNYFFFYYSYKSYFTYFYFVLNFLEPFTTPIHLITIGQLYSEYSRSCFSLGTFCILLKIKINISYYTNISFPKSIMLNTFPTAHDRKVLWVLHTHVHARTHTELLFLSEISFHSLVGNFLI